MAAETFLVSVRKRKKAIKKIARKPKSAGRSRLMYVNGIEKTGQEVNWD